MQKLPVQRVCPGHGEMGGLDVIEKQKRYFVELREAVQRLIDKGRTLDRDPAADRGPFIQGVDRRRRQDAGREYRVRL